MNRALLIVAVTLVVMVVDEVTGECCPAHGGWWWKKGKCNDCTKGTPCCGHYRCNFLCCDCGAGCRSGSCGRKRSFLDNPVNPAKVFSAIDVNGDSVVDKDEFYERANEVPWPAKSTRGLSDEDFLITEFEKMDKNGDGMISPGEFDADLK